MQRRHQRTCSACQAHGGRFAAKAAHTHRGFRSAALDERVADFVLLEPREAQRVDQPVELRLDAWPEPRRPEVEAFEGRYRRVDQGAVGPNRQDAATEHSACLEQYMVANTVLIEQQRRQQAAQAAADDGDAGFRRHGAAVVTRPPSAGGRS